MLKKITSLNSLASFVLVAGMFASLLTVGVAAQQSVAYAADIGSKENLCSGADLSLNAPEEGQCNKGGECLEHETPDDEKSPCVRTKSQRALDGIVGTIVSVLSIIVGVVAVIMVIFSGFKYITSGGDSGKISSAKTTLIYAIVGLIIVALAQVMVRFVLDKV